MIRFWVIGGLSAAFLLFSSCVITPYCYTYEHNIFMEGYEINHFKVSNLTKEDCLERKRIAQDSANLQLLAGSSPEHVITCERTNYDN